MRIDGPLETPTVTPIRPGLFVRDGACLRDFTIAPATAPDDPVWEVRIESGSDCVQVAQVTYGEAPAGLVQIQPARPLAADTVYQIGPNPWGPPLAEIAYTDGRWRRLD